MRLPIKMPRASASSAVVVLALGITALASACDSETRAIDLGREPTPSGLIPEDASTSDGGGEALPTRELCIASECPDGLATCGLAHKCTVDVANDRTNCGACGHECPPFPTLNIVPTCAGGECRYECDDAQHLDCNGMVEDGCEVDRMRDPTNCGACGHVCPEGVRCIDGACGCPKDKIDCDGFCADVKTDKDHCSKCGRKCPYWEDEGWPEPPANMQYGCRDGACKELECVPGWRNCDGRLDNGCEIDVTSDPKNCMVCGKECAPGQICATPFGALLPTCLCNAGETLCGDGATPYSCADLQNDVRNCGACYNDCNARPLRAPNTHASCNQGRCERECLPGFADCDGDPGNGCEVNTNGDASNCGGCGNKCDTAQGQPCIAGACLMRDCDAGGGPTR